MLNTFDNEYALSSSRNLAGSAFVAGAMVFAIGLILSAAGKHVVQKVEKAVEVTFVEEAPPEPVKPPPPAPKLKAAPPPAAAPVVPDHLKKIVVDTPPPVKPLEAPVAVDKAPLAEADPAQDKGVIVVGQGEGDPAGLEGGTVGGVAGGQVKPEAPALPEKASAPVPLDTNAVPEYPADAKAAGLGGMVILKVVIDAGGAVEDVVVMRGESPFVEAALKAVKTWRYEPARVDGQAMRVYRIIKIPFRLRT